MKPAKKPPPPSSGEPSRAAERQRRQFDERDRLIRDAAQRLLHERGLHGFSMEDVAAAIQYSKGTVYLHYTSKEDALVASCADRVGQLAERLERAAAYPGTTRERMLAITETHGRFVGENPVKFRTLPIMHSPSVLEKAAPERRQAIDAGIERTLAACTGVVREAVTRGDLELPADKRPEDVSFALFALMFGSHMLADLHAPKGLLGVTDPAAAVCVNWETYMDGLGWKPVLGRAETDAAYRRIRQALFPPPDREPDAPGTK